MKSLSVVVLSYLLLMAIVAQVVGSSAVAAVLCMFPMAFFDKMLGKKKTVAAIAVLALWSMVDETVPFGIQTMHIAIGALAPPPPQIEMAFYAFITMLVLAEMFTAFFIFSLSELLLIKYLVKRWRLKERIGCVK